IQQAVVTVLVQEYDNGEFVGSTMRDMQIIVINCNNVAPTLSGINGTNEFQTFACPGDNVCFNISSFDPDPGQSLTVTWNNGIPGGTFTSSGSPFPTSNFCWTPGPNDGGLNTFIATVTDDACPIFSSSSFAYSVFVPRAIDLNFTTSSALLCYRGNNASITAVATGGFGPLSYVWNTSPPRFTPTINNLSAGSYTVTVTDSSGCSSTVGTQIIQEQPQINISFNVVNANCGQSNGSATAVVTGGSGGN